jgi:DNA-binding transcriptional LysR family regulator
MTHAQKTSPQRRPPTLEALRALMVYAETGSVSETARRLGVSQPVVTKKLEVFQDAHACGAVLLRFSGKTALTESARAALPAIQELVRRYDRLLGFLRGDESAPQVIRIGTGSFAAEHYLPRVLVALRDLVDECQIETRVCRGRERIVGTADGTFDLGIVTHDEPQIRQILREERIDEHAVAITPLGRHPMCVIASRKTLAGRELEQFPEENVVPVTSLTRWELIGPDSHSGLRRQLERQFAAGQLYFVAEGGGWSAGKEYARAGLGVAIVPLGTVTPADHKQLVCRRLAQQFAIADFLVHRQEDSHMHIQRVNDVLLETVSEFAAVFA